MQMHAWGRASAFTLSVGRSSRMNRWRGLGEGLRGEEGRLAGRRCVLHTPCLPSCHLAVRVLLLTLSALVAEESELLGSASIAVCVWVCRAGQSGSVPWRLPRPSIPIHPLQRQAHSQPAKSAMGRLERVTLENFKSYPGTQVRGDCVGGGCVSPSSRSVVSISHAPRPPSLHTPQVVGPFKDFTAVIGPNGAGCV